MRERRGDGLVAVGGLADDVDAVRLEDDPQPGAHEVLVVGDDDTSRHAGSRADTAKPPSGRAVAVSDPPNAATRSRIPTSPWPAGGAVRRAPAPSSSTSTDTASAA